MKKIFAVILTLVMLLSVVSHAGTVAEAAVASDPYVAMTWDPASVEDYGNIAQAYIIRVRNIGGELKLCDDGDNAKLAATVKAEMDKLPDGMKYIRLFNTAAALAADADLVVFADGGVRLLKKEFDAFINAYKELGGELDGIILDTEYVEMGNWYLYGSGYGGVYEKDIKNHDFYNELVAHPQYESELRPMLVEAGFKFYEKVGGDKSELWSIYPYQYLNNPKYPTYDEDYEKYKNCSSIWNRVMYNRIAMYLDYALYEPMKALYPDATMSDYQSFESGTWYKNLHSNANGRKTGNVSNYNDYSHLPSSSYFKNGSTYLYQNPASYNNAVYDDDPYGMLLWNVNKFKNMREATDTELISVWISRYDYTSSRTGSYAANTAYYTESLYHYGMLDPQPFLVYMTVSEGGGQEGYNERLTYMSEALSELTRVAGYADREPISVPVNWNDGYLLSGIYANGKNIWRITPDTTDGTTLAEFKVKDSEPTFKINGTTITFPGGKIIKDTSVTLGSCGYWVETAKDVTPVVTRDADRYSENPSYVEDYESYAAGAKLTADNVALPQTWEITADKDLVITAQGSGKALALTGTATLTNVKLPENITAGDSFAQQQAWEISVTLSKALNSGAKVVLLNTELDGGFKLEGDKVYYDEFGKYIELPGVTLTAGKKYTFKRDINFNDDLCTYSVYADGKLLKQVTDVDVLNVVLPVEKVGISCEGLSAQALIDDYKLYPSGVAADLSVYDAYGGEQLTGYNPHSKAEVVYRLSWLNATAEKQTVKIKAVYYNSSNAKVSEEVIATVNMAPGHDAVIYGTVKSKSSKIRLYVDDGQGGELVKPNETPEDNSNSGGEEEEIVTKATQATEAAEATKATLTKPTRASKQTYATKATTNATEPSETAGAAPETKQTEATAATESGKATVATKATAATAATDVTEETEATAVTETTDATDVTQGVDATDFTEATEATAPVDETPDSEDKDGVSIWLIVAIAVVVLAGAGAAVFFLVKKKSAAPATEETAEETEE